jgi:hypothetical protein
LAAIAVLVSLPAPASAFPCGEAAPPAVPSRQLSSVEQVPSECNSSAERRKPQKTRKKGSVSGLTVFVLVVAGALLIPIGRNGIPRMVDPYGHDRPF